MDDIISQLSAEQRDEIRQTKLGMRVMPTMEMWRLKKLGVVDDRYYLTPLGVDIRTELKRRYREQHPRHDTRDWHPGLSR